MFHWQHPRQLSLEFGSRWKDSSPTSEESRRLRSGALRSEQRNEREGLAWRRSGATAATVAGPIDSSTGPATPSSSTRSASAATIPPQIPWRRLLSGWVCVGQGFVARRRAPSAISRSAAEPSFCPRSKGSRPQGRRTEDGGARWIRTRDISRRTAQHPVGASVRLGIANRGDCEFDLSDDGDSSAGPLRAQAGDLPTGPYQTRVHTEGQRQTQAAGHLNLAGSGLHDSSNAGAGADLRSRPSIGTLCLPSRAKRPTGAPFASASSPSHTPYALKVLTVHARRALVGAALGIGVSQNRRHPVPSCFDSYDHLTRPLRSSPITEPSSLLWADPTQLLASVLSPRGVRRLCFSLGIQELVPAVPRNSLCPAPAPYTPVAARPVIRLPAD